MKYFSESEFSNFEMMDQKLLKMLDRLREVYGDPIKLTSKQINQQSFYLLGLLLKLWSWLKYQCKVILKTGMKNLLNQKIIKIFSNSYIFFKNEHT